MNSVGKITCVFLLATSLSLHNYTLLNRINKQDKLINEQLDKIESQQNEIQEKYETLEDLRNEIERRNEELKQVKVELKKLEHENEKIKGQNKREVSRGKSNKHKTYNMEMTSYTAFCPEGCIGKTRTGYDVSNTIYYKGVRVVAVDPNIIPLYSYLKIETENETFYAYALDTGGAIKGNIIDLLVENEEVARKNGRQKVKVTILREGKG